MIETRLLVVTLAMVLGCNQLRELTGLGGPAREHFESHGMALERPLAWTLEEQELAVEKTRLRMLLLKRDDVPARVLVQWAQPAPSEPLEQWAREYAQGLGAANVGGRMVPVATVETGPPEPFKDGRFDGAEGLRAPVSLTMGGQKLELTMTVHAFPATDGRVYVAESCPVRRCGLLAEELGIIRDSLRVDGKP